MKKINTIMIYITFLIAVFWAILHPIYINFSRVLIILVLLPILYIPRILKKIFSFSIDNKTEFAYILFILLAQVFGSILRFYQTIPYYDKFIHFVSGFFSCMLALLLLKQYHLEKNKLSFRCLFLFFTTLAVAACWEIFEYTSDIVFHGDCQNVLTTGIHDTMQDILMAFLASILFLFFYFFKERKRVQ